MKTSKFAFEIYCPLMLRDCRKLMKTNHWIGKRLLLRGENWTEKENCLEKKYDEKFPLLHTFLHQVATSTKYVRHKLKYIGMWNSLTQAIVCVFVLSGVTIVFYTHMLASVDFSKSYSTAGKLQLVFLNGCKIVPMKCLLYRYFLNSWVAIFYVRNHKPKIE